ncbi:hypothetical protein FE243_01630 [Aliarcobacter thereius]|uniref:hypothetical protein n=1 Tax=Aliarcobacter thereius TaxID=544718 RepID=UPI0010FD72CE|nr:hypothetical protein [Aliarcobacter thereius]TLT08624.1 hypothetical protein FE243_01630 [Aliarcobacter thereius]
MKELTAYYLKKNILFKEIKEIFPKEINSRKKIKMYVATSLDLKFYAIFILEQRSRFLRKNADELMSLENSLSSYIGHNFKIKELLYKGEMCSKAKEYLKDNYWGVKLDFN